QFVRNRRPLPPCRHHARIARRAQRRDRRQACSVRNRPRRRLLHLRSRMNSLSHRFKILLVAFSLFAFANAHAFHASAAANSPEEKRVTFNKHLAPVVFRTCAPCHHPVDTAPFALLTYG